MPPQNLRIPGPTPLPEAVREAGTRQMINHRGPEFQALVGRVSAGMRPAFGTRQDVLILTASGTGGLESAIVSFLSPGDAVLAVSIGNFGERFAKIAGAYGADVTLLESAWGQAADPDAVRQSIRAMSAAVRTPRAVLVTFNETSTGVTNPLAQLASAIRAEAPDALILVDGISAIGAMPFEKINIAIATRIVARNKNNRPVSTRLLAAEVFESRVAVYCDDQFLGYIGWVHP